MITPKAELSSRWKGGLAKTVITVTIGDHRLEVTGRNPENNNGSQHTAPLDADDEKRAAYDDGVADTCNAWRSTTYH